MRIKEGDIFEIKVNENDKSYGQIISTFKKKAISIVIYEGLYTERPNISEIISKKILFFGNTFDAKFYHRDWVVFDNDKSKLTEIKMPYYKIGIEPVYIEDFLENKIRIANSKEVEQLRYRDYIAPIRFESALKAYYEYIDWDKIYDELLYEKQVTTINPV